ncbi:hypothetical protein OKW28_003777 [Paraburkholderia sp. 40]
MVLFDQVIEIFRLADVDGRFTIGIDRGEIGAAFVDGYRLVYTVLDDRFLKVAPGRTLSRWARCRESIMLAGIVTFTRRSVRMTR